MCVLLFSYLFVVIFIFVCYHETNFVFARSPVLSTSSGSVFCPQQHNLCDSMIVLQIFQTIITTITTTQPLWQHDCPPNFSNNNNNNNNDNNNMTMLTIKHNLFWPHDCPRYSKNNNYLINQHKFQQDWPFINEHPNLIETLLYHNL